MNHSLENNAEVASLSKVIDTTRSSSLAGKRVGVWQDKTVFFSLRVDSTKLAFLLAICVLLEWS